MSQGKVLFSWRIDECLQQLFAMQLESCMDSIHHGYSETFRAEIQFSIAVAYFSLSFRGNRQQLALPSSSSAGMRHFNLFVQHNANTPLRTLLFLSAIYIYQRVKRTALVERWNSCPPSSLQQRLASGLVHTDLVLKSLAVGNSIAYLTKGTYPDLLYTLSLLSAGSIQTQSAPLMPPGLNVLVRVNYHKLLWGSIQGLLKTGIFSRTVWIYVYRRIVGAALAMKISVATAMQRLRILPASLPPPTSGAAELSNNSNSLVARHRGDHHLCAVCHQVPESPHISGCGHVHCYYCLQVNIMTARTHRDSVGMGSSEGMGGEGREGMGGMGDEAGVGVYLCQVCGCGASFCSRVVVAK